MVMVGNLSRGLSCAALALCVVGASGCDDPNAYGDEFAADDGGDDDDDRFPDESRPAPKEGPRAGVSNGFILNGFILNGFILNGFVLNGFILNGDNPEEEAIQVLDIKLAMGNDEVVDSWVDGGNLHLQTDGGDILAGSDLEGTKISFDVTETNKKGKTVRINSVAPVNGGSGVLMYDADLKVENGPWEPLCTDAEGNATEAFLIGRVWSSATGAPVHDDIADRVTFACRGAALAKCIEFGYVPWQESGGSSLSDIHQACTRMVRADYCGDGLSHTLNGTLIHILDQAGIQLVDPNMDYVVEAEWGPDGATCLNVANTRIAGTDPGCQIPACGSDFESGGLLQSGKVVSP
jgi:hypothetical protein